MSAIQAPRTAPYEPPEHLPAAEAVAQGQRDWFALIDALDAECPLLEAESEETIAARPGMDPATPAPADLAEWLPSGAAQPSIDAYLTHQRHLWHTAQYGHDFVRQVEPSEQFHQVPMPLRTGDDIRRLAGVPDGESEGLNFLALLEGDRPQTEEGDDHKTHKGRRVEHQTPAEREAELRQVIARNRTGRLTAMFAGSVIGPSAAARVADFSPIILVPSLATAPLQIGNIAAFLNEGHLEDPAAGFVDFATGTANRRGRPLSVTVAPGRFSAESKTAFTTFEVYDDPQQLRPEQWRHVCAAIVTDETWQFADWFPAAPEMRDPSRLFAHLRGFIAFFEEDIYPHRLREWRTHPLRLTRKKPFDGLHISQAYEFWRELLTFIDTHEYFRQFTIKA